MSQPRRGIRVTLITALLTALVATVAAPSVFAVGTLVGTYAPTNTLPGATVPATTGAIVLLTTTTTITGPGAIELTFPSGSSLPSSGWTVSGNTSVTSTLSSNGLTVRLDFLTGIANGTTIGITAGGVQNPFQSGSITVNTYAGGTVGSLGTGSLTDTGSVVMGLAAFTITPSPAVLLPGAVSTVSFTDGGSFAPAWSNPSFSLVNTGVQPGAGSFISGTATAGFASAATLMSSTTVNYGAVSTPSVSALSGSAALQGSTARGAAMLLLQARSSTGNVGTVATSTVAFRPASGGGQGKTEREHSKGARKVAFYAGTAGCTTVPAPPTTGSPTLGFAIFNTTGHNGLNVTVSLKGATPNAKYAITVYVQPSSNCPAATFTVWTNSKGNGSGHKNVRDLALTSGTMQPQAWVTAVGPTTLVTTAVTLPMKGHGHENAQGNQGNQDNPGRGHGKG